MFRTSKEEAEINDAATVEHIQEEMPKVEGPDTVANEVTPA